MKIGKFSNEKLKKIVLDKLKSSRDDVLIHPGVGEDCCAIQIGDEVCVLSTDPITGASNNAGNLAVHITANDIASSGVAPAAMLVTILVPPSADEKEVEDVISQITATADSLNIEIVGGHTEVTDAVNRIIVSTTALGKTTADRVVTASGAKPGDYIVFTKEAGIEGTYIIVNDHKNTVNSFLDPEDIAKFNSAFDGISVVQDGLIAANIGVSAMHDVTEGGVLGAVYEMCEASGNGAIIYEDNIPVASITKKICDYFKINPLRLISSGSMLITTSNPNEIKSALELNGIKASIIGRITDKDILSVKNGITSEIDPPASDELYKIQH